VVTPKLDQFSMIVINKLEDKLNRMSLILLIPQSALALVSGIILLTYIVKKNMHTFLGSLMILYNSAVIFYV